MSIFAPLRASRNWLCLPVVATVLCGWAVGAAAQRTGEVQGRVLDARTRAPLAGANVLVVGTRYGAAADEEGRFVIRGLPPGVYEIQVRMIGYRPEVIRGVAVLPGRRVADLTVELHETAIEVDPIVVSAAKREQLLRDATVSISVVTERQIRRRNPLDLAQAIEMVPGVHFVGNQINVRGSTGFTLGAGNKVLLLLDGVPVYASDTGEFNWDMIPPDEVERIEVVKGAGSALWGASALGGVVNIITKEPRANRVRFGFTMGKYDRPVYRQWIWTDWDRLHYTRSCFSLARRFGRWALRASLGRTMDTGYRQLGDSKKFAGTLHLSRRFRRGGRWITYVAYSWISRGFFIQWKGQNHPYEVDPTELNNRAHVDQLNAYTKLTLPLSPRLAVSGRVSVVRTLMGSYLSRPTDFNPALGQGGEVQVDWLPGAHHSLTIGFQVQQDGGSARYFGRHRGLFLAPYVQDEIRLTGELRAILGLRYDRYRLDSGRREDLLSPRLGINWQPGRAVALRASAGSGFRAATIVERFLEVQIQNFTVRPNPGLRAERSWAYDLGARLYPASDWVVDFSLFRNEYWDLIEAHLDLIRGFIQFRNIPRARIQGVELTSDVSRRIRLLGAVWTVGLRASATLMHHEELEFHDPLPYRPKRLVTLQWTVRGGRLDCELDYRYASRIEQVKVYPINQRVPMKFWDLHVGMRLGSVRLRFSCRNLTNYNYAPMESNLEPPRRYEVSLVLGE